MTGADTRFFFVHVMKTGGSSFRRHIERNFTEPGAVYPCRELDGNPAEAAMFIDRLLMLSPERRSAVRAYTGHFPFVVADLLDPRLVTLTLLRDPVERTISYLKDCSRGPTHHDRPLEAIYDDEFVFHLLVHNHQTKIFAMTPDDRLESYLDFIEIDDARAGIAKANLERVGVLGVQERYDTFLGEVGRRFGWDIRERPHWRVSRETCDVSHAFRQRIAADNRADIALYEYACELVERRTP